MKKRIFNLMLAVAMALSMVACNGGNDNDRGMVLTENTESLNDTENLSEAIGDVLGEGAMVFTFTVVDMDGNETVFEIHTDKEIVGDALLELGLIEGEEGAYGLFVKTVNGVTADYDADGAYWAFYVNGEYATSGVDTTPITEGETYMFKVEKA